MNKPAHSSDSHTVLVVGAGGEDAVELLSRLGLSPAVLDTPTIERLGALRDAEFAVVLPSSGDDAGMMLAIGFMLAALGRERICLLAPAAQQLPAALQGALRIAPDDAGVWQLLLAREMKRAGLEVDLNKAL